MMFRLGLAVFALCVTAAANAGDFQAVDARLRASYPPEGPGAYAIVAAGDRVVFSQGYGQANVELHVPLQADSVFRIASLTKQFTSVAILLLVEEHKLTLDEPLHEAWVQCPGPWREITVRQLLSHTSGMTGDLAPLLAQLKTDLTIDQLLAIYADRPLLAKPGAAWLYSNVNYWILGKLIEIASGARYADFVTRGVLVPRMTRTRYGSHDDLIEGRAAGYEAGPDGHLRNARYFSATLGFSAGGFLSTPGDMTVWYAALGRGDIISRDSIALALTPARTSDGKSTGYGLGWYVEDLDGTPVAHHGGSTFGFESYVFWAPSRGIFSGVFKNRSDSEREPVEDARALFVAAAGR
jgi:CubicO group peptidase (beta-lactamase class C family)